MRIAYFLKDFDDYFIQESKRLSHIDIKVYETPYFECHCSNYPTALLVVSLGVIRP